MRTRRVGRAGRRGAEKCAGKWSMVPIKPKPKPKPKSKRTVVDGAAPKKAPKKKDKKKTHSRRHYNRRTSLFHSIFGELLSLFSLSPKRNRDGKISAPL